MKKVFIILLVLFMAIGTWMYFSGLNSDEQIACTMEAKICPDGSAVGRSGPRCEFTACPEIQSGTKAKIGEKILNNGIFITPVKVVSDSRCPSDVRCIQAGTVMLEALLQINTNLEEKVLSLEKGVTFGGRIIDLIGVSPSTNSKKTIKESDYVFEFSVK